MFLLIREGDAYAVTDKQDLHSNMFLLILSFLYATAFPVLYLHSNMFLLIRIENTYIH